MNKKEIVTPLIVGLLAIGFAYVCVMVFLSKGKSAKWISRKMKIGGLLLSFTAVVQSGCMTNQLCYKFADPIPDICDAEMKITCVKSNLITGKLKKTQSIYDLKKGYERWKLDGYDSININEKLKPLLSVEKMKDAGPADLSYEIVSCESNNIIKKGVLVPTDGKFNSDKKEKFKIEFDKEILAGKYFLKVYYKNLYSPESFNYPDPFKIEIGSKIIKIRK